MKIILVNKYLYPKGGDAVSTINLGNLLSEKGHEVIFWGMKHPLNPKYLYENYFVSTVDYENSTSIIKKIDNSIKIIYSIEAKRKFEALVKLTKPDIIHLNNFAHQISPSILDIIKKYNLKCVMTMHDYKLVCPTYSLFQNNKACEKCRFGRYYNCLINKCTKKSLLKSLINTLEMYIHHDILDIYKSIRCFISPSEFLKNKLIEMGFKRDIVVIPNYVNSEKYSFHLPVENNIIVYFGRLSPEKGIETLFDAVKEINVQLKIIGTGPLEDSLKMKINRENITNIDMLGYMFGKELHDNIKDSLAVIVPSIWLENNPLTILEAFAFGRPVIGSHIGGIPELVKDNVTGLTFTPGSSDSLKQKIVYILNNKKKLKGWGQAARNLVETRYNSDNYYQKVMEVYKKL